MVLVVKNPPANTRDIRDEGWSLCREDLWQKGMATHSRILAWKIPGQRSLASYSPWGCKRVGHDWCDLAQKYFEVFIIREWGGVKSLSRVRLFVTPWTAAYQVPPSMGFSRQEYWSGLPFPSPGDLPDPGIEPMSPTCQVGIVGRCFTIWATRRHTIFPVSKNTKKVLPLRPRIHVFYE